MLLVFFQAGRIYLDFRFLATLPNVIKFNTKAAVKSPGNTASKPSKPLVWVQHEGQPRA